MRGSTDRSSIPAKTDVSLRALARRAGLAELGGRGEHWAIVLPAGDTDRGSRHDRPTYAEISCATVPWGDLLVSAGVGSDFAEVKRWLVAEDSAPLIDAS